MRRTALFTAIALAATMAFTGCAASGDPAEYDPDEATGAFDWKRYEGAEIHVLAGRNAWQERIEARIPQFEELTGIKVTVESLVEEQFYQKLQVELSSGSDAVDVYAAAGQLNGLRFSQSGWFQDLQPYVDNPALTSPDYNFDDISSGILEAGSFDGELYILPTLVEVQMLYYLKDKLEEAGIEPPTTAEELEAAAALLNDPENGVHGIGLRGKRAPLTSQFGSFLVNFGVDYTDAEGNAGFDNQGGVDAFDLYGRLLRNSGPSGSVNNGWEELLALFQQGKLAMWADNSSLASQFLDPEKSTVYDNVGFAEMPTGHTFFGWGIAMNPASSKKGPAWLLMQWMTSPEIVEDLQADGVPGARESIGFPADTNQEFAEVFLATIPDASPQLPNVIQVPEVRDIIGDAIAVSIEGGDVARAVSEAAAAMNQVISTGQ